MGFGLPRLAEVFGVAFRLGLTSFGGPVAHIAYFRKEYVERRGWLDDASFSGLAALAQILPGPSSSQLGMAVGHLRAGVGGAVAAWLGFTLPSALLMVLLAVLWGQWSASTMICATHGLLLVAAAVVTQAVGQLYRSQCATPLLRTVAWVAFAAFLVVSGPFALPAVLLAGAATGAFAPSQPSGKDPTLPGMPFRRRWGVVALVVFAALALLLPWLRTTQEAPWAWADAFYRTGSWVFGGGHVVVPWLQREVVGPGWVTSQTFLAGYGAAQALPGPLFAVSAFLGMVLGGWPGATIALVAIFLPGFLLIEGFLPFWSRFRGRPRWTGAFAGASAVVVGLLAFTLATSIGTALVRPGDWVVAAGLLLLLEKAKWPSWAVVLVGALVGDLVLLLG